MLRGDPGHSHCSSNKRAAPDGDPGDSYSVPSRSTKLISSAKRETSSSKECVFAFLSSTKTKRSSGSSAWPKLCKAMAFSAAMSTSAVSPMTPAIVARKRSCLARAAFLAAFAAKSAASSLSKSEFSRVADSAKAKGLPLSLKRAGCLVVLEMSSSVAIFGALAAAGLSALRESSGDRWSNKRAAAAFAMGLSLITCSETEVLPPIPSPLQTVKTTCAIGNASRRCFKALWHRCRVARVFFGVATSNRSKSSKMIKMRFSRIKGSLRSVFVQHAAAAAAADCAPGDSIASSSAWFNDLPLASLGGLESAAAADCALCKGGGADSPCPKECADCAWFKWWPASEEDRAFALRAWCRFPGRSWCKCC
mmetsp:Transcript_1664/g.5011  ORF Transcript_1664/g.5011 Transcript_1664/m.5011 type:complete len:365 (-) Transcript_1664:1307-2401(-)